MTVTKGLSALRIVMLATSSGMGDWENTTNLLAFLLNTGTDDENEFLAHLSPRQR